MPRWNALTATAVLALIALSGCGKHDSGSQSVSISGPTDAGKVANIAAASIHPKPGRWEATVKINHIDMPGMSPNMLEAMQRAMTGAPMATCLTPEQAAKPAAEFFSGQHHACTYDSFTMAGGQLNAVMHCSGPSLQMKMTMNGTYQEDSYDIHSTSTADLPGGKTLSQDTNVTSKWVGACTGNEVNARPKS